MRLAAAKGGRARSSAGRAQQNVERNWPARLPPVHRLEGAKAHDKRIVSRRTASRLRCVAKRRSLGLATIDATCKFVTTSTRRSCGRSKTAAHRNPRPGRPPRGRGVHEDLDPRATTSLYGSRRSNPRLVAHPRVKIVFHTTINSSRSRPRGGDPPARQARASPTRSTTRRRRTRRLRVLCDDPAIDAIVVIGGRTARPKSCTDRTVERADVPDRHGRELRTFARLGEIRRSASRRERRRRITTSRPSFEKGFERLTQDDGPGPWRSPRRSASAPRLRTTTPRRRSSSSSGRSIRRCR